MNRAGDNRVVVTGCGLVTPLGLDLECTFDGLVAGEREDSRTARVDVDRGGATDAEAVRRRALEVERFDVREHSPQRKLVKTMDRQTRFAIAAGSQAGAGSDLAGLATPRERIGTFLGVGTPPIGAAELATAMKDGGCDRADDPALFGRAGMVGLNPLYGLQRIPNLVTSHLSIHLDAQGPCNTTVMDSAASLQSIGEASHWIREGLADLVAAGGTDSPISPFELYARSSWPMVCSTSGHDCFASRRAGSVLSEGAAVLVLESLTHAEARDRAAIARSRAEILGYGSSFDATPAPGAELSGSVAARSMRLALERARLNASDIDAVFAAGLATRDQDLAEARAIHEVFGNETPVVTLKRRLGNSGAACGAVEAACAIEAMNRGLLPGSDLEDLFEPASRLRLVREGPLEVDARRVLVHAISLGGLNCSLVLGERSRTA